MPGERRISKKTIDPPRALSIAVFIVICDQLSKLLIQQTIPVGDSIPVINKIFHLTLVYNSGAAFGIFKAQSALFIAVGIIAVSFALFYLPRLKEERFILKIGLVSILGGTLGNLIDRLRFGYVIDFFDFRIWPVFNIADAAITVGALLICIQLFRQRGKAKT